MPNNILSVIQRTLRITDCCIFLRSSIILGILITLAGASTEYNKSGITFKICDLELRNVDGNRFSYDTLLLCKFGKVEAAADIRDTLANNIHSSTNAFVEAAQMAFISHHSLILSPDMIWLLICQGFVIHLNQNRDSLREHFVNFEGNNNLRVEKPDFRKLHNNLWEEVFDELSMKIGNSVKGPVREIITTGYSTTTSIEKAAFQISLLDAMSGYYSYTLDFSCGIPSFTLEGTVSDWVSLRERAGRLREYKLDWWIDSLMPVLDKFVDASKGKIDIAFWKSIFSWDDGCNGLVTGWITRFFPYTVNENGTFNRYCNANLSFFETPKFPNGLSRVPFALITENRRIYDMEILSGFFGYRFVGDSCAVRPVISWVVREVPKDTFFDRVMEKIYNQRKHLPHFLRIHYVAVYCHAEYILKKCHLMKQNFVFNNETTVRGERTLRY